jgi:Leu/Phe-tRNA-protein transferase
VAKKASKVALRGCKSRYFSLWLNLYDKLTKEVKLDKFGAYALKSLAFKKFFGRWRNKYIIV